MSSIVRIATISNKIYLAKPLENTKNIIENIKKASSYSPDIIVFPSLCLTGGSCGDLYGNVNIFEQTKTATSEILIFSKGIESYIIFGVITQIKGNPSSAICVIKNGEFVSLVETRESIYGLSPSVVENNINDFKTVFACGNAKFNILSTSANNSINYFCDLNDLGCDFTIMPTFTSTFAGQMNDTITDLSYLSKKLSCAIIACNGGIGETSTPLIYKGYCGVFNCSEAVDFHSSFDQEVFSVYDLDIDLIRANKRANKLNACNISPVSTKKQNLNKLLNAHIERNPYLPKNSTAYLLDIFKLQVAALVTRLSNTQIKNLVIGVSGGINSTLALLVCIKAMDILNIPRKNISAVTMPGFETTEKTFSNAKALIDSLGCTHKNISITNSVTAHFNDIGHDINLKNTTYQNAQARERSQILFDIGNMVFGLVIGTGDMSEAALGEPTFAGDHLSNFNINASITKTMIRLILKELSENQMFEQSKNVLNDIINAPISQDNESMFGPYELHEFFLYYFVRLNFSSTKVLEYATLAFSELDKAFIKEKLILFITRFINNQFKRSCSPDSPNLTPFSIGYLDFYIPSDYDPAAFTAELGS